MEHRNKRKPYRNQTKVRDGGDNVCRESSINSIPMLCKELMGDCSAVCTNRADHQVCHIYTLIRSVYHHFEVWFRSIFQSRHITVELEVQFCTTKYKNVTTS